MAEAVDKNTTANLPAVALNRPLITLFIMAATVMQALDATIANVALPKMQGALSATQDQIAWVLTSYIVASAIMIPLTGWLAGQFGRKRVLLVSVASFTITSALCGIATSLPEIVLFRLMQGMAGAALVPLSQAVLFDINPPERHGKAMAVWGMGVTMGPILGPALGGWLTESYNWRWVFYINLPIGIAAFLGLLMFMPEMKQKSNRFDFFGFLMLSLSIGALQMCLDRGELLDWFNAPEIIIEATVSALALYLFIVHTMTREKPFLSPALFKDRNFLTANLFIFLIGVILFATLALIPPMLQNELGYPVITTGFITAPRGIGTMMAMMLVGKVLGKIDTRLIIACGLLLTALSLWQMTHFSLQMNSDVIVFNGLLQGFGIGLSYVPLATVAFSTLSPVLRNEGTAFFNLMRNIGSAIGISVVEALLTRNTQIIHTNLAEHITPYNVGLYAYAANHVDTRSLQGLAALNQMVNHQATMIAYINDFKMMMMLTLGVIPLLFLLRTTKKKQQSSEEVVVME